MKTLEDFEDAFGKLFIESDAIVADTERPCSVGLIRADEYSGLSFAILDRIADQILKDLAYLIRIDGQGR